MMDTGDTVKYAYVTTAGSMPVSKDSTTIYFDENEKKISVGDVKFDGGTVPTHSASDVGKMLSVNAQNGLEWKNVPKELPVSTPADEGKVLKVDSNGDYVLGSASGDNPITYIDCDLNESGNKIIFTTPPYNTIKNLYFSNKYIILRVNNPFNLYDIKFAHCVNVSWFVEDSDNPTFKFCYNGETGGGQECYYTEMYSGLATSTEFDWYYFN